MSKPRIKYTIDIIKEKFSKVGYKVLDTVYVNSTTPISYECNDGHLGKIRWNNFSNGQRCNICAIGKIKYTIDDIQQFVESIGFKLLPIDQYKDNKQKLDVMCDKGHKFNICFNKLKMGTRCKLCVHDNLRFKFVDVKKEFEKNGCTLLSTEYKHCDDQLEYICKCGNISHIAYYQFKLGHRCGCVISRGENKIKNYLMRNNINYYPQKTYPDCKGKQVLHFDFLIDDKYLIEYDGSQHFTAFAKFGGENSFEQLKMRDNIKNQYCIKNNIKLLRISFKEYKKLDNILDEYIKNINKCTDIITYTNDKLYETMINNLKL
jgi:hypothetical protein